MGWIYIIIRTFPFWAIPTGIALIFGALDPKSSGKKKLVYAISGIVLIGSSVFFLIAKGHETAVPFFHKVFTNSY